MINRRLGDNTAKDALLLSERREKDALKKALTESEYKNEELLMKTEEANKKVEHLQNTINSYVPSIKLYGYYITSTCLYFSLLSMWCVFKKKWISKTKKKVMICFKWPPNFTINIQISWYIILHVPNSYIFFRISSHVTKSML